MVNIKIGEKFPEISAETFDGQLIKLADFKGKKVVIYFYPKDFTSGCTIEAKDFNKLLPEFDKQNTQILGISVDSLKSHQSFCQKLDLKFPLISDSDKKLVQKLGIMKPSGSALRTTFLLDKEGKVTKIYQNVIPLGHAKTILEDIKSL